MTVCGRINEQSFTASRVCHRVAEGPGDWKSNSAEVEKKGVDLQTCGDLSDTSIEHGIARDPEHPILLRRPSQREPDHIAR